MKHGRIKPIVSVRKCFAKALERKGMQKLRKIGVFYLIALAVP